MVLTDLGLGSGMDGWELADRIRRDWPHVHVIVASGRIGLDTPTRSRAASPRCSASRTRQTISAASCGMWDDIPQYAASSA